MCSLGRVTAFLSLTFFCALALVSQSIADEPEDFAFDQYFIDKALRLEFYQTGDARELSMSLQSMVEEPTWPENPGRLSMPFPYGKFVIKAYEPESKRVLYSKGFDTLYAEFATTRPAHEGSKQTFQTTARIPMPKAKVLVKIERRLADNSLATVFEQTIDPADPNIRHESIYQVNQIAELQSSGHPHDRLDLVFLAEGYTLAEKDQFFADAKRMTEYLFSIAPYKSSKDRFNIKAVFEPSQESGTDNPGKGIYKNTLLSSSFNTLGIDRYLLLEENHRMHRIAAAVPYDNIVVLVNSKTYGGGSICLDFCITTTGFPTSPQVFVHELGHGLSYLADEYVGNVSYNDMYPDGIEPVEPNITRELSPDKIKWKKYLTKDVKLPTQKESSSTGEDREARVVGAFEGGGYISKGMYRPENKCWMGSNDSKHGFCMVCEDSIQRMIDYYAPPSP